MMINERLCQAVDVKYIRSNRFHKVDNKLEVISGDS